jgi:UDP-N-acetylmuramate--alanine ligase
MADETRIHLIGIGGTGLSAIARFLLEMGRTVSGSDRVESPFTRELQAAGAIISIGHNPENVRGAGMVVRSSAIPNDNPEVVAARAAGIPVLKRADFLGTLMEGKSGIAVAGTHGKTTTTAMIAWILSKLDQEPSFIAGGVLTDLGVNARAGKGTAFVIEADEYDRMFLGLKPTIAVITNVEHDHPDYFPTPADFQAAFVQFVRLLPPGGTLIACAEDPGACAVMDEAEKAGKTVLAYGLRPAPAAERVTDVFTEVLSPNSEGGYTFSASILGQPASVALKVPGKHNVANALAALTVSELLSLPLEEAAGALGNFHGTGRRFEVRGEVGGITIIDDYAHHPTEIVATLSAARSRYPGRRIWAVWQPHTYSRTRVLGNAFAQAFTDADEVVVTEIYAAREPREDYSAADVVQGMPRKAHFIPELKDVSDYLLSNLRSGDVVLVLSAGDADAVSTEVLARLKEVQHG